VKTYQASQVGCIASIPDLRRWWVEGGVITDQGQGLHAFNATLRHQIMSIGEGLGPEEYKVITLNKSSPTAELANLVRSIYMDLFWLGGLKAALLQTKAQDYTPLTPPYQIFHPGLIHTIINSQRIISLQPATRWRIWFSLFFHRQDTYELSQK